MERMVEGKSRLRKFSIPQQRRFEVARLDALIVHSGGSLIGEARLVAVRAPAGYGKTTLLAQLARQAADQALPVIWLACDEDDSDTSRFAASLVHAAAHAGIVSEADGASDGERLVALSQLGRGYIFLDDFERAASPSVERFVERLYERLNPGCAIVIGTRQPLGSWFLRREVSGEAVSVGAKQLSFSVGEMAQLLPNIGEQQLATLEEATEGWPFAVALFGLRQEQASSKEQLLSAVRGSTGLADYLSEQVMSALPDDERHFLRDMAALGSVDAAAADVILRRSDSATIMRSLNLLEPVMSGSADDPPSLHIHPLFREFLLSLEEGQHWSRTKMLHRRAALHFETRSQLAASLGHAVAAGDAALVEAILARQGNELTVIDHGVERMQSLLSRIPSDFKHERPAYTLIEFVAACATADRAAALASASALRTGALPPMYRNWPAEQWIAYADSLLTIGLCFCDGLDCQPALDTMVRCEADAADFLAAEPRAHALLLSFNTLLALRQGEVTIAKASLDRYRSICEALGIAASHPSINPQRGLIAYAEGRIDAAHRFFAHAADVQLDAFGAPEPLLAQFCRIMQACLLYRRGAAAEALSIINSLSIEPGQVLPEMVILYWSVRTLAGLRSGGSPDLLELDRFLTTCTRDFPQIAAAIDMLRLEAGMLAGGPSEAGAAARVFETWRRATREAPAALFVVERIARAAVLVASAAHEVAQARSIVSAGLEQARRSGQLVVEIEMNLLLTELAARDGLWLVSTVAAALSFEGADQLVADVLHRAAVLLPAAVAQCDDPRAGERARWLIRAGSTVPVFESLTERERDVAIEMIARTSNKEIARALGMSPETVKHHLHNIFLKLGCATRQEAVERLIALPAGSGL